MKTWSRLQKNWRLNCFFSKMSTLKRPFESLEQNKKESRKLYFRAAIKFTYSLALTWKVGNEGEKYEIPKNNLRGGR